MADKPELDRLVTELHASGVGRPDAPRLEDWLAVLRSRGASDLYLVAGLPPSIRVQGSVQRLPEPPLDGDEIEETILPVLPLHAAESYRRTGIADASLRRSAAGRFRVNLHRERGRP